MSTANLFHPVRGMEIYMYICSIYPPIQTLCSRKQLDYEPKERIEEMQVGQKPPCILNHHSAPGLTDRTLPLPHATLGTFDHGSKHVGSEDAISFREITCQHPGSRITLCAQLLRLLEIVDRVIRLVSRHRVHEVASDAIHPRVLNDHGMTTVATFLDIGTLAIRIATRAANGGAHALDAGTGLLADPHEEHGFDGREVPVGFGVVAFGDALPVAAGEQMMTHDPAVAFPVGSLGGISIRIRTRGPGGGEPGGVVGVLGHGGVPFVVGEGGVPCLA